MSEIKAKILLVDDRPENLFALERIVNGDDRELYKASSGSEALKLNLEHEFALILSDVQMPEMDGFEMLEILRMDENGRLIPVIFLTALSKEDKYIHKGYSEGAVDYLFKPLDANIVRAKVDMFISLYKNQLKLSEQATQLRQMNDDKNKFLGMAAHDLRNPIGVIEHYSKFLIEDLTGTISAEALSFLEIIKTSSHSMNNLVIELLDISKIESGEFSIDLQAININDVIQNAITMNRVYAQRKDIKLITVLDNSIPITMVDPNKIGQVIINLVSNAIKYSEHTTSTEIQSRIEGGSIVISVEDQGLGIDEKDLKTLFDAFSTTENKGTNGEQSTGLGLMIAAKIVGAHSGEIKVESEKGVGSTFTIEIPMIEIEEKEMVSTLNSTEEVKVRPDLNVLLVDDNEIIRMISQEIFRPHGVNLIVAVDGSDAMEKLNSAKENNQAIDIVFTDLNMPSKDGFEFTREVRLIQSKEELPIIGLSATLNSEEIDKCNLSGMNSCNEKPVNSAIINHTIAEYNL